MSTELVVVTTSSTDPSTPQYDETFGPASDEFEKLMGPDHKPTNFEYAKAPWEVLEERVKFDDFRSGNEGPKMWLESYVELLFKVSAKLWENTKDVSLT
jgi:hypothetical protein